MSDPAPARDGPIRDEPVDQQSISSEVVYPGTIWDVRSDVFRHGASHLTREYLDHPGAVAVLALDADDNALLIRQYRHPIGARDWELPAGLLDLAGEGPLDGAKRELAEEADVAAEQWSLLTEFFTSPGGSNEMIRVYLARGITATEAFDRVAEEADLETRWVALDDVVSAVLERRVTNSILSIAALAAHASRARGWSTLGDPETDWLWHPRSRRS